MLTAILVLLIVLVLIQFLTLGAIGNMITLLREMEKHGVDIRKEMYRR